MTKFEIGKTYFTSSACDHNCIFKYTVIKTTKCFVTLQNERGEEKRVKIHKDRDDAEYCFPAGHYSMCPVLFATDTKVLKPDWMTEEITEETTEIIETPELENFYPPMIIESKPHETEITIIGSHALNLIENRFPGYNFIIGGNEQRHFIAVKLDGEPDIIGYWKPGEFTLEFTSFGQNFNDLNYHNISKNDILRYKTAKTDNNGVSIIDGVYEIDTDMFPIEYTCETLWQFEQMDTSERIQFLNDNPDLIISEINSLNVPPETSTAEPEINESETEILETYKELVGSLTDEQQEAVSSLIEENPAPLTIKTNAGLMELNKYEQRQSDKADYFKLKSVEAADMSSELYEADRKSAEVIPYSEGSHIIYDSKTVNARSNLSISSDDPDAIPKMQDKIAAMEERQQFLKSVNKICRKPISSDEKRAAIAELGLTENQVKSFSEARLYEGFPAYELANNAANIRRCKKELKFLLL